MHSDFLKPVKLLLVADKGNEVELNGTIGLPELDSNSISDINPYENVSKTELSMTIDIDNSMKLTRKKLVKLLMSKGIQRNGANEIARYVLKKNGKYTMFDLMLW